MASAAASVRTAFRPGPRTLDGHERPSMEFDHCLAAAWIERAHVCDLRRSPEQSAWLPPARVSQAEPRSRRWIGLDGFHHTIHGSLVMVSTKRVAWKVSATAQARASNGAGVSPRRATFITPAGTPGWWWSNRAVRSGPMVRNCIQSFGWGPLRKKMRTTRDRRTTISLGRGSGRTAGASGHRSATG